MDGGEQTSGKRVCTTPPPPPLNPSLHFVVLLRLMLLQLVGLQPHMQLSALLERRRRRHVSGVEKTWAADGVTVLSAAAFCTAAEIMLSSFMHDGCSRAAALHPIRIFWLLLLYDHMQWLVPPAGRIPQCNGGPVLSVNM